VFRMNNRKGQVLPLRREKAVVRAPRLWNRVTALRAFWLKPTSVAEWLVVITAFIGSSLALTIPSKPSS